MSREAAGERQRDAVAVAILLVVASTFVSPIFRNLENLGGLDWDYSFFLQAVPRKTLLEHGQFPLWNPYEWGGIPMLGNQASRFLSPTFVSVLAFGPVVGAKVDAWVHLVLGLLGTYALARALALTRAAAVFAACGYLCSGWFALVTASGMSMLTGAVFFPWALAARLRAHEDARFIVALGAVCSLVLFDGSAEPLAMLVVALGVHEVIAVLRYRCRLRESLRVTLGSAAVFVCISAVKLFPAVGLLWRWPRFTRHVGGYSVEALLLGLLERGQKLGTLPSEGSGFWRGMGSGVDESGAYVGIGIVVLAALGFRVARRPLTAHAASLFLFVWMAFGPRAPFGPWQLLHAVPPFAFMRVPERFRFVFLLDLALLSAAGVEAFAAYAGTRRWSNALSPPRARAAARLLCAGILLDVVATNRLVLRDVFTIPAPAVSPRDHFAQVRRLPCYDAHGFGTEVDLCPPPGPTSALYPALLAGFGSARGFDPVGPRGVRVRLLGAPDYVGEQWLSGTSGTVASLRWTPNALELEVKAESAGRLVVNQAFDTGWKSRDGAEVFSEGGLIAVPVGPGITRVELVYRPTSFVVGATVSGLSALVLIGLSLSSLRRRNAPRDA